MHAKIENNTVIEWPIVNLRQLFPNSSLPEDLTQDLALPTGYVHVNASMPPAVSAGEKATPSDPVLADGKWYQGWSVGPLSSDDLAAIAVTEREQAKQARTATVEAILVTTAAGNTFQGDEVSQGRMSRAILGLSTGLAPSVRWVLADNTVIAATSAELIEALVLAGQAQASVWVL